MAIVVEDGSGTNSSANSYASEADLTAYAADRGVTVTGTASQLLLIAMDFIESRQFLGNKNTADQPLVWPRNSVWVDGFRLDSASIPQLLIGAQIEAALAVDAGNSPTSSVVRAVKSRKIDGLETVYMDNATTTTVNRALNVKLAKLLLPGNRLIRT